MSEEKVTIIISSGINGIISNISNFGVLTACFYLNYRFIGGNNWLDFLISAMFIVLIVAKVVKGSKYVCKFKNYSDAIEFMQNKNDK